MLIYNSFCVSAGIHLCASCHGSYHELTSQASGEEKQCLFCEWEDRYEANGDYICQGCFVYIHSSAPSAVLRVQEAA